MFISRDEIERRRAEAPERVRPIIGEEYIYYHVVGKPNNPSHDYGICGSQVIVAGFRYSEDENSPYDVDLAIPTQTEDLFVLMSNVRVETAHAVLEGNQQVVFVEYEHREWVEKAVNAWVMSTLNINAPKKRPNHLSLVVDNVNTVEALAKSFEPPEADLTAQDIVFILEEYVGPRFMPTSRLETYGKQKFPLYLKALDDGDFMRLLLDTKTSGLFKRDALSSTEVWCVLAMENYNIIITLRDRQVFFGARGGVRARQWGVPKKVDKALLLKAIGDL